MAGKPRWYSFQFLQAFVVVRSVVFLGVFGIGFARTATQPGSRITQSVDDRVRVTLQGNVHPLAQLQYDRGAVADSLPAERMFLMLRRPPEREAALRQFLQDAHTPGSANYHEWLRPEQFGELYGPDDAEIGAVTAWLQKHGFTVARVSKGKTAVEFSGTAGQVREAFGTDIHTYFVNGEEHHANSMDPQIPAALAPVIAGITPMNDFPAKAYTKVLGKALLQQGTHKVIPQWTLSGQPPLLALAPGDFAVQYDLGPLYSAGVNGNGVTIGIISLSNVDPAIVAAYRSLFGLPAGTLNVIVDGSDPGQKFDVVEAHLDVEAAGAVAPGATINLYAAASTTVQDGLILAAQRAVDDDQATVLSTSYGTCEKALGSAGNLFWAGVWEQAAAQGQTSFVSAGDGGSAGCDDFNAQDAAQHGLAVSGFASTPWNIAVGGTDFFYTSYAGSAATQNTELARYWNLTASKLPSPSLLKPVPEQPWNRAFGLNLSTNGVYNPPPATILSGSGGASNCATGTAAPDGSFASCTAGYAKPTWQSGKGVPVDGVRDLPDVSLFAAVGENESAYPICVFPGECTVVNGGTSLVLAGGTSASSPAMAGIMALVNQKFGAQGQANYVLYALAAQHPTVFHDITMGSNNVPCLQNSPNCAVSTLKDNTQGFFTLGQFYSGAGYDQATGLGSVDANLLVTNWNSLTFAATNTTLNLSQTSFAHGTPINVSAMVTGSGGTPSGDIALVTTATPSVDKGLGKLTLQSGAASGTVNDFPGGQYQVTARYAGDAVFAPSVSSPVSVTVTPENSTVSVSGNAFNPSISNTLIPISNGASFTYGTLIAVDAQPRGVNAPAGSLDGVPTGTVTFSDAASSGTVGSGSLSLNSKGLAEWIPANGFPAGSHSVGANYSGDPSFDASSSATPLTFTITKASPGISLFGSPKTIGLGSLTVLTAQVEVSPVVPSPTGTVTFNLGSTVLGSAPLAPVAIAPHIGQAILNVTSLPLGTDSVTATYNGDSNNQPATSSAINIVVMQNSNLSAVINPPAINIARTAVITATVPGVSGQPTPTGSIGIFASGPGTTCGCGGANLVNGSATINFDGSLFNVGNVSIQVGYSGDSIYAPATVTLNVMDAFPFTAGATPLTITAPGATTGNTSTITLTPVDGFTGAVYLSCALTTYPTGAVDPPTCSVPASVNIPGTAAVTATMTVNSTAAGTAGLFGRMPRGPLRPGPVENSPGWLTAWAGALVATLLLFGICRESHRRCRLAGFLFVLFVLGTLAACGGGGGNSGPPPNPGTTAGTYTFTVTGSFTTNAAAGTTQSTTVTVTIQ